MMASSVRRRFSYNSSGDKEFRRSSVSQSKKLSVDSCVKFPQQQQKRSEDNPIPARNYQDTVQLSVVSPRSRRAVSPVEEHKISPNRSLQEQTKGDFKSILKKQSSDAYNYASLLRLAGPDSSNRESISRDTDSRSLTGSVASALAYLPNARHLRKVRFSESVSFINDGNIGEGFRTILGQISKDAVVMENCKVPPLAESNYNNSGQLTVNVSCMDRARLPERKLSDSFPIQTATCKKELKVEPVLKRSKLASGHSSTPKQHNVIKSAWSRVNVSASCDDISLSERRNKIVKSTNRSLERSKTTLGGPVDYSSVKSKLRRMGFFDSSRKMNGSRPVSGNADETADRSLSDRSQKLAHNYSTFREELYTIGDYQDKDDPVSLKYINYVSPANGCLRSLGDEYARFLKGRYSVDDVTCS